METESYYDVYWSPEGYSPETSGWHPKLKQLMEDQIQPGARVLDFGCGDGSSYAGWLKERGCSYQGVDISANAVDAVRAKGLEATKIDSADSLPFDDHSFDVVLSVEVFEHLFQPQSACAEIHRVLKPGGILIATVPNVAYWRRRTELALFGTWNPIGDNLSGEQPWRDPHIRFFTHGAFHRMLSKSGFQKVELGGHGGRFGRDIPVVRKVLGNRIASPVYQRAEDRVPSLLGLRIHAVARKDGPLKR